MSDRIAVISDGEVQQCAPPLTCYNQPANTFVAEFIGSPSMNMFDAVVDGNALDAPAFSLEFDHDGLGELSDGDQVRIGVRPEDIYLASDRDVLTDPSQPISVTVDVLEPIGDQTFAYLFTGGGTDRESIVADEQEQILMSADPDKPLAEDETVEIVFARQNVHVFDGATGDAIGHSLVAPRETASVESEEATG